MIFNRGSSSSRRPGGGDKIFNHPDEKFIGDAGIGQKEEFVQRSPPRETDSIVVMYTNGIIEKNKIKGTEIFNSFAVAKAL